MRKLLATLIATAAVPPWPQKTCHSCCALSQSCWHPDREQQPARPPGLTWRAPWTSQPAGGQAMPQSLHCQQPERVYARQQRLVVAARG
ncbi:hypothetical protein HaLaN_14776 [Haematococcus lacustris]|uniref:Uncharacterized protein n=1 Tax=Haematococcus lacustris TaxID=44745 RepID=A0A699Z9E4_HAELA|nr:hypothetical protein HaLaN_14776 [Haematococcus lacustris]